MHIVIASIVTAFAAFTVGTKVFNVPRFQRVLDRAVADYDFTQGKVPGQAVIPLPDAVPLVGAGIGQRTLVEDDYVHRAYRGRMCLFLRRGKAATVKTCSVVVYTADAYAAACEKEPEERDRVLAEGATHVLVAVLTSAGPETPPYTPDRLLANLAGGNAEAEVWTADEIRAIARETVAYDAEWCVVAD